VSRQRLIQWSMLMIVIVGATALWVRHGSTIFLSGLGAMLC
jgi:hypothetical protein